MTTRTPNKKILFIDCATSGIAGDMMLGALLDLGANTNRVIRAIKTLEAPQYGYEHISIDINQTTRGTFRATQIDITSPTTTKHYGTQLIETIEKAATNLNISKRAKEYATKTIHTIIDTEAKLHKTTPENTHLHEVALIDTAAEIIGCAVALDDLNLFENQIYATPLAVGGGIITFSHGTVTVPAPATLEILQTKNYPFHGGPQENELATPTGTALLVNLTPKVTTIYPPMKPLKTGYGTGTKEYPQKPTALRLTLGKTTQTQPTQQEEDQIAVIETNLDDTTGEIIGYTINRLITEGAKDVSAIPTVTKKNRPGHIIKVITDQTNLTHLIEVLTAETGTLGVRIYYCQRHITNREQHTITLEIANTKETIHIKLAKDPTGKITHIKPEYEDLKHIAEKTKQPLQELQNLVIAKIQETYPKTP